MDTANNANFKVANQNEKDLRARLTKEYETSGYGDKKPGISPAENIEIGNRISEYRRQTTELIQKAKGADISNDLNDLYLKATAPQQQRAQRRAQQPAYASPETVKSKLDRTSAEVKRNYRSGPLYPEAILGKQLDDVAGGRPLDDTTKEIIRRLGVTPLEYFTQQNDKHAPGKPLPAPALEKLKELDKVSLALPVSGGGSMGLGMITPDMARAQRLWNAIQPRPNSSLTPPANPILPAPTGSVTGKAASIREAARQLGIDPIVLAAVIHKESSYNTTIIGGAGNRYQGLIQFGPTERRDYGYSDKQTFEQQMLGPVVRYLKARGVKPGHGAKEVYAAILTGHVDNIARGGLDWSDNPADPARGTTVRKALPDLERGVDYKAAVRFMRGN